MITLEIRACLRYLGRSEAKSRDLQKSAFEYPVSRAGPRHSEKHWIPALPGYDKSMEVLDHVRNVGEGKQFHPMPINIKTISLITPE